MLTVELLLTCYSTSCSSVIRSYMVSIDKRHPSCDVRGFRPTTSSAFGPEDEFAQGIHSEPSDSLRMSKDNTLNSRGRLFLDLLASTNITLLNGNTIGDIFGEFTSVNYNGNSVIDYMAVSAGLADNVVSFKVGNFTAYSDHKPCHCTLNINHDFISGEELLARLDDVPIKYKWINENGESKKRFLEVQDCPAICDKLKVLQSTCCQTPEDVKNLNNDFVEVFKEIADISLPTKLSQRRVSSRKKRGTTLKPKKPWFDAQCINAKRIINQLAKRFGKNPKNQELR